MDDGNHPVPDGNLFIELFHEVVVPLEYLADSMHALVLAEHGLGCTVWAPFLLFVVVEVPEKGIGEVVSCGEVVIL